MRTFGLIGYPLVHSFSQKYFSEKFERENISDAVFENFPLQDINDLPALIESKLSLCGLSVTIPHKQSVMKFLDKIDGVAEEVGAANCIKIHRTSDIGHRTIIGYNTDVYGFEQSFRPLIKPHHDGALILGTGGAALAVKFVLDKIGFKNYFVSRHSPKVSLSQVKITVLGYNFSSFPNLLRYDEIDKSVLKEHNIIINTTPLGMFPDVDTCPSIPYEYLTEKHLLYDLIYNPEKTLFLKKGKERGAQTKNGLEMLQLQAEKAWEIWNDQ